MKWLGLSLDKWLHLLACYAITLTSLLFAGWWGVLAGVGAGLGKELYDRADYGLFSWGDIVADAIGVALACLVYAVRLAL